jgi:hypothetical protein
MTEGILAGIQLLVYAIVGPLISLIVGAYVVWLWIK